MTRTPGSADPAPVLVLGLGNPLLRDDGVGLELLAALSRSFPGDTRVEFLDGGTQGVALIPYIAGREALLILDAVALGAAAGTVHRLDDPQSQSAPRGLASHEANAGELLAAAGLLDDLPDRVLLVGVEPADLRTGTGLSEPVRRSLDSALDSGREALRTLLDPLAGPAERDLSVG